jgi:hypothetical protein
MRQNDPEFDAEFEQALATYADPADAGHPQILTARVLAAVENRQRQRRLFFGFAVAVPALACFMLAAFLLHHTSAPPHEMAHVASRPVLPAPVLPSAQPTPVVKNETRHSIRSATAATHSSQPKQLPKLDQFPAPSPLTEQEQMLISFATQTPTHTQQSVAKAQQQTGKPLHIAELSIPPIESSVQQ